MKMSGANNVGDFWASELDGAKLPDQRFFPNLVRMCSRLEDRTGLSFSSACGPSTRKSAYRLFSKTEEMDIQWGHKQNTVKRSAGQDLILIVEDTTDINYSSHKSTKGLGNLGGRYETPGICLHSAIALSSSGEPFGLVGQYAWAPKYRWRQKQVAKYSIEEKESYKWIKTKEWVNELYSDFSGKVLVIGDREADIYEHFSYPRADHIELLFRAGQLQRTIIYNNSKVKLKFLPDHLEQIGERIIQIERRKNEKKREVRLAIKIGKLVCPVPSQKKGEPLELTLVHVKEIDQSKDPVEWYLLTTQKVDNLEHAQQLIDFYTTRWTIERFHYVLKSGMRIEQMQFDNFTRLTHAIEVCSMVAWKLLWLNYIARIKPDDPAKKLFDSQEINILEKVTKRKITTNTDYILALGSLSGFVKSKAQPLPGEKLLWQAVKLLHAIKTGVNLSKDSS
jgi:hypothetical protein